MPFDSRFSHSKRSVASANSPRSGLPPRARFDPSSLKTTRSERGRSMRGLISDATLRILCEKSPRALCHLSALLSSEASRGNYYYFSPSTLRFIPIPKKPNKRKNKKCKMIILIRRLLFAGFARTKSRSGAIVSKISMA